MRNKENKHLSIEIDPVLHGKLIRQCVRVFEEQNGEIIIQNTEQK